MVRKKWIILGGLIFSLLFASAALANRSPSINWWVIGGGSDERGSLQLGPGFWGGGWDEDHTVYLPVVLRGFP
jgi:hypothetical protein